MVIEMGNPTFLESFVWKFLFPPSYLLPLPWKSKNFFGNFLSCISGRTLNHHILRKSNIHPIFSKDWFGDVSQKLSRWTQSCISENTHDPICYTFFIKIIAAVGDSLLILTNIGVIEVISSRSDPCVPAFLAFTWPSVKKLNF